MTKQIEKAGYDKVMIIIGRAHPPERVREFAHEMLRLADEVERQPKPGQQCIYMPGTAMEQRVTALEELPDGMWWTLWPDGKRWRCWREQLLDADAYEEERG